MRQCFRRLELFWVQIRALGHDQRGVSAVEFAILVPVMALIYIGTVEISNLLMVVRRVETVASTAADLSAQVKQVSTSDLADIFAASTSILTPYPATPLRVVVSSVVADVNNNGVVAWSCASKGAARAVGSSYVLPTGTTVANSSVIVAEITYAFTPLLDLKKIFSPGALTLQRTYYERPRRSLTVSISGQCPASG
jgi:Flp pilus assembly protein TadG